VFHVVSQPPSGGFSSALNRLLPVASQPSDTLHRRNALRLFTGAAALSMFGACTTTPIEPHTAEGWHDVPLPGKRRTAYRWELMPEGRVLVAQADSSASMYRKRLTRPADTLRDVEFSWMVQALPEGGDVSDANACDAAARVLFAFGGDHARLSSRNQLLFELARTLTGEAPPFATLAYVWDTSAPVGRVVTHPRSDRVRKIVVESGPGGLRQWKRYRRTVGADYRLAFGEAPGPLLAVAVMTDGDNTRSHLTTRYRDISLP
jgi:Protein of unknown function (DUF3047)